MSRGTDSYRADLWVELLRGNVYECPLVSRKEQVYGYQVEHDIYIDPRRLTISTLLHELTHRRYPEKTERQVERAEGHLIATMDEATLKRWWKEYRRIRVVRGPLEILD